MTTKSTIAEDAVQHTPGPWFFGEVSHEILGQRGVPVAAPCDDYDEAQWIVDGALIAAAPDLLASLREFVALYDGVRDHLGQSVHQKLGRAEAALAKAGAQ